MLQKVVSFHKDASTTLHYDNQYKKKDARIIFRLDIVESGKTHLFLLVKEQCITKVRSMKLQEEMDVCDSLYSVDVLLPPNFD